MVRLPQHKSPSGSESKGGCGSCGSGGGHCGEGLEKIYPTTAVRYGAMNFIGEFTYKPGAVFQCGGKVVIQSDRGIELGEQVSLFCNGCSNQVTRDQIKQYINNSGPEFFRLNAGRIIREATPDDINDHKHLNAHVREDIERCATVAMQLELPMKIVTCEHLLGGERIVFYFRSNERVDFRELVRVLASHYRTRIEMRQVGARDEARLVADYEICGRECCCKNFLKKLRPVSMKMAKVQKATLDPAKVSGRCGRLRCCLRYEHEGYEALMKKLPRLNSRVRTEFGEGLVIDRQILTQLLMIELDDHRRMAVPVEEITEFDLPPRARISPAPPDDAGPSRSSGEAPVALSPPAPAVSSPEAAPVAQSSDVQPTGRRGSPGPRSPRPRPTSPASPPAPSPAAAAPAPAAHAPAEPAGEKRLSSSQRRRRRRRRRDSTGTQTNPPAISGGQPGAPASDGQADPGMTGPSQGFPEKDEQVD